MRPQTLSPFEKGIQTKALGKLCVDSIMVSNRIDYLIGTWPNSCCWVVFKWRAGGSTPVRRDFLIHKYSIT